MNIILSLPEWKSLIVLYKNIIMLITRMTSIQSIAE